MTKQFLSVLCFMALVVLTGCKEKKQSVDIIAETVEAPKPSGPISMQPYHGFHDVQWLGKNYKIEINRVPNDSLPMVKDETGQQFVDNRISLVVRRADGSVAIQRAFTKANFEGYVDANYRKAGILEGFVFDSFTTGNIQNLVVAYPDNVANYLSRESTPGEYVVNLQNYVNSS